MSLTAELTFSRISRSIMKIGKYYKRVSIQSLPPELLHEIFAYLGHQDHPTLSACVRTCKLWYEVARPHLLSRAVFRGLGAQDRFYELCSSKPNVAAFIQVLRLQGLGSNSLDLKRLASTLCLLPALHTLSLVGFDNRHSHSADTYEISRNKPIPLTKLSITSCMPGTFMLSALLCLFSVDTLEMCVRTDIPNPSAISAMFSSVAHTVHLRHLVVEQSSTLAPYFDTVFLPLLSPGTLRSFSGTTWMHPHAIRIRDFLCSAPAHNLCSLSLQVYTNTYTRASAQLHLGVHRFFSSLVFYGRLF